MDPERNRIFTKFPLFDEETLNFSFLHHFLGGQRSKNEPKEREADANAEKLTKGNQNDRQKKKKTGIQK